MSGFDEALEQAISALHQGVTVDDCLARYPEHAEQLRPLLALAAALYAAPTASMSPQAFDVQRERLRAGVRAQAATPVLVRRGPWMRALASHRLALLAAALLLALILGLRGVTFVGAKPAPNEALYPVKRAMEAVVLILPASSQTRATRALNSAESRLTESSAICATDPTRAAALRVEMRGQHDAALSWLAGQTGPDAAALRERAALLSQREADIAASCARRADQLAPAATSAPIATPTLAATATTAVTATPSMSPSATSSPTRVITYTPTASPTATDTPPATLPPPTATISEAPAQRNDEAPTKAAPGGVPTRDVSPRPTNVPAATAVAPSATAQPPLATATQLPAPTTTSQPLPPTPTVQVVEVTRPAVRPTATPAPRLNSATPTPQRP